VTTAPHTDPGSKDRGHEWEIIITAVLETFNVFACVGTYLSDCSQNFQCFSPDGCDMSPSSLLSCELFFQTPKLSPTVSLTLLNDEDPEDPGDPGKQKDSTDLDKHVARNVVRQDGYPRVLPTSDAKGLVVWSDLVYSP
jgi:hypothetical protein